MKTAFYSFLIGYWILLGSSPGQTATAQIDPFIGQILEVGYNYCPRGTTDANGQLLDINTNQELFALYGTIYGGDGRTTFGLPDLRGRRVIGAGTGAGLSTYAIGETGGAETVTLTPNELPSHNHTIQELTNPQGSTPGLVIREGGGEMDAFTGDTGSGLAHENRSPYQVIRYCVALTGIFPSRN